MVTGLVGCGIVNSHINKFLFRIRRGAMSLDTTRSARLSLYDSHLEMRTVYVFHNTLMFYSIRHFAKCALQIAANLRIICELQTFPMHFLCS